MVTGIRKRETGKLVKKVEFMIIIRDENSSNIKKLYNIARADCPCTICIEHAKEIKKEEIEKYSKIGIMAGVSISQKTITEVKFKIEL